jgi:hypothetical protein
MAVRMVMAIQRKYLRQGEKEGVFILVVISLYKVREGICFGALLILYPCK